MIFPERSPSEEPKEPSPGDIPPSITPETLVVRALGGLQYAACGLIVLGILFQGLGIAHQQTGLIGILVGLFVFPILTFATPFHAGFAMGNWRILQVDVVWLVVLLVVASILTREKA